MVFAVLELSCLVPQNKEEVAAFSQHSSAGAQADASAGRHNHHCAQSCCLPLPRARILPALAAGYQLPASVVLPVVSVGAQRGRQVLQALLIRGTVTVRQQLSLFLCRRIGVRRSALLCNCSYTAWRNGLLPSLCRMFAWQRQCLSEQSSLVGCSLCLTSGWYGAHFMLCVDFHSETLLESFRIRWHQKKDDFDVIFVFSGRH